MRNNRTQISNKIRFEIFKRDSFTCQYCGRKSPEIILNVDHIKPVKEGGTNDLMNLITSCFECNNGKRDIELNDSTVIGKQQNQLEELNERRIQLEMMLDWRNELDNLTEINIEAIERKLNKEMVDYSVNENYRSTIKKLIKKYDINQIFDAIDTSSEQYIRYDSKTGNVTRDSAEMFLSKIEGILYVRSLSELGKKINHLSKIGSANFKIKSWQIKSVLDRYVEPFKSSDIDEEYIISILDNNIMPLVKERRTFDDFNRIINEQINFISSTEIGEDKSKPNKSL